MSHIREKTIEGLQTGDTFSASRTFTEQDVIRFAGISNDYNPVHFDERFAKVKRFDGRICQGLLIAGLLTEIGGQIGWLASKMTFEFKKPVYFGDTVTCVFTITEIDGRGRAKARAVFTNQRRATVMEGFLAGILPGAQEKQVMKEMLAEGDPTNKISR